MGAPAPLRPTRSRHPHPLPPPRKGEGIQEARPGDLTLALRVGLRRRGAAGASPDDRDVCFAFRLTSTAPRNRCAVRTGGVGVFHPGFPRAPGRAGPKSIGDPSRPRLILIGRFKAFPTLSTRHGVASTGPARPGGPARFHLHRRFGSVPSALLRDGDEDDYAGSFGRV